MSHEYVGVGKQDGIATLERTNLADEIRQGFEVKIDAGNSHEFSVHDDWAHERGEEELAALRRIASATVGMATTSDAPAHIET